MSPSGPMSESVMHRPLTRILLLVSCVTGFRCGRERGAPREAKFFFAGACVRSKMSLVAASFAPSLRECAALALRRKGLAVNFINRELLHPLVRNYSMETCLVFDCPEFDVQMSLEIDSLFDYYSTYARPMPNKNVTCVPRIGVFQIHHERVNFTDAEDICESENGTLADITNGPRSTQLGSILTKEHVSTAYIGLAQEEGRFTTPEGLLLECLPYRAWAPGYPRKEHKCAAITDRGQWVSYDCKKRLPFICELKQSGPLRPCINLPGEWRKRCRQTFVRSYPTSKRRPQCGDPRIDENTYRLPLQIKNETTENKNATELLKNMTTAKPPRRIPN